MSFGEGLQRLGAFSAISSWWRIRRRRTALARKIWPGYTFVYSSEIVSGWVDFVALTRNLCRARLAMDVSAGTGVALADTDSEDSGSIPGSAPSALAMCLVGLVAANFAFAWAF